jgi:phosphoenolpyruvate carboxykinase (GTP)
MTREPPSHLTDWRGNDWTPESDTPAAHPNARFTVAINQCPSVAPEWDDPNGVPIDAVLFGGRRATVVPLVHEARDWEHGVFLGSIMSSETTAAQAGAIGQLRFDPMAMLPFCGYNMADYFAHWLEIGRHQGAELPRIFYVNWFRKDDDGKFLWPGFGENSRVPTAGEGGIDLAGLDIASDAMTQLLEVDPEAWKQQLPQMHEHYARFGDTLPAEMRRQLEALEQRLDA